MNTPQLPRVELVQGSPGPEPTGSARWRRLKVFFIVLLLALVIGLAIVYGRAPIYRAAASVLTVKPKAVDTRSAAADLEHVAIQERLLLGEDLQGRLIKRLADDADSEVADMDGLQGMLGVVAVPDTNLLELRAEGENPQQLQRVVNHWAGSYEAFRAQEIEAATKRTTAELDDQQIELQIKIDAARAELQAFREAHDIISLERDENRSLSALNGLNNSLNKARERLIEATARQIAIDEAIARGETVIPSEQKAEIAKMQLTVQRGRAQLADLKQKYTQRYIDRDPALKSMPNELRAMEHELANALQLAKATVRDEAQQEVEAARVSVETLEQNFEAHQKEVQQFTDRFKEFKSLEEGLARLDRLYAENRERLAQIQVQNLEKYPPVQVVEWARIPSMPIYPDYERDLMIALAAAFGLALFATWLFEYLSERSRPGQSIPYLGVRVYPNDQATMLGASQPKSLAYQQDAASGPAQTPSALANPTIQLRELAGVEIKSLMAVADPLTEAYATLLLSGISPYELPLLQSVCFERGSGRVSVPGASRRELDLGEGAWRRLEPLLREMDGAQRPLPLTQLDLRLKGAARDGQLAEPGSVNALSLWYSYVLFLVRQGIDASSLVRRVGTLSPDVRGTLMQFAPPSGTRPLGGIEFIYPILVA